MDGYEVVDSYKRGKICWWHNGDVGGVFFFGELWGERRRSMEEKEGNRLCFSGLHGLVK
jgi:hypothetical protein